jgi:probable F420-dependent oxidoreductase
MRIVTTVPQHDLRTTASAARALEARGFDGLVTLENRHDPFLPLAAAALATTRTELATGIALAFVRSPLALAHTAWDLNVASGGRFVLGLGPQVKAHNEKRYSVPWEPPVARMRDCVGALRAIWSAWHARQPLRYEGRYYRHTLMPPNFVPEASAHPQPPITLAAVGPAMARLAAEVADGVRLHPFCTRRYIERVIAPAIDAGLARSGRAREHFEINGGGFIASGATAQAVREMSEWVRYRIAFYASTPAYWPVLEAEGLGELGPRLNELTKRGAWDALAAEVPDELLAACSAIGPHGDIAERIGERYAGLVDTVHASASSEIESDLPASVLSAIKALPSAFRGFSPTRL